VYGPEPIIIDKENNVYIVDQGNARIAKYNDKGELERYFNYYNYTDYQTKTVKWAIGGNLVAIQDNILYTNLYYYKKYSIISFNVITGEIIEKVNYNSIKYHKELTNMIFYDTNEKYKIGETGEFKSLKERKEDSVVNMIEKNYPRKLGTNYFISYLGLDSLKNKYYEAYITRIRSTIGSDYICLYKFSKDNKLLAYIGYPLKDYLASEGTIIHITPNGDIYFLYPSGKVFIKDWKQKFIPGKIQLIKWELQK
jgi:hypothetical protein